MAGVLNKILSFAGIYDDPYETQDDRYEDNYYESADDYADDEAEPDGSTLNERFRSQAPGRTGGPNAGGGGGRAGGKGNLNNVVNLHPQKTQNFTLVTSKPERLEEAQLVCDHLKERHVVIVNVEGLDGREAQRIVDFIGGALYSLEGEIIDITNRIFAIAPSNVDLVSIQRETRNRGFLSFGSGANYNR